MSTIETAAILRQFNAGHRGVDIEQPGLLAVGEAIDAAVEMIDRLEAAESEVIEQARLNGIGAERELVLMARIERLEHALRAMTKTYKSVAYAQWPVEMHLANEVLEDKQ